MTDPVPTSDSAPDAAKVSAGVRLLGVGTVGGWIIATAVTGTIAFMFEWDGAVTAWIIAAAVGLLMVAATLPILLLVAGQTKQAGTDRLIRLWAAVLGAGVVRVMITGLGIVIPVKVYETATWATFGFVAGQYLLLTLVEVGVLGRMFWLRDGNAPGTPLDSQAPTSDLAPDSP